MRAQDETEAEMNPLAGCAAALTACAGAAAANAQVPIEEPDPRIVQLTVYGDDPCPVSTGDEIIVCARRPEEDRYRIPERLRETPGAVAWARRIETLEMATDTGIQSCSTVGPGGWTGCWAEMMRQARRGQAIDPTGQRVP